MDRQLRHQPDAVATPPADLVTESCDAGVGTLAGETAAPGPIGTPLSVDLWTLARFKELMDAEGWPVQTARMIFDRVYAHERLAVGHTSSNDDLRSLSLDIFKRMHARDGLSH